MEFSETIEIKVQDKSSDLALDSYFFAYFNNLPGALEQIRDAVRAYRTMPSFQHAPVVVDTTTARSPGPRPTVEHAPSTPDAGQHPKSPSGFKLTSLLRPLQETLPIGRSASTPGPSTGDTNNEDFTHIIKRSGSSFVPIATAAETTSPTEGEPSGRPDLLRASSSSLTPVPTPTPADHTYPPSMSGSSSDVHVHPHSAGLSTKDAPSGSGWSVGMPSMPSWLRVPSRSLLFGAPTLSGVRPHLEHAMTLPATHALPGVTEIVSSHSRGSSRSRFHTTSASASGDFGFFSILETPHDGVDAETVDKFRQAFAFDDKENLLGSEYFVLVDGGMD